MTVGKLIEQLKTFSPDMRVELHWITDYDEFGCTTDYHYDEVKEITLRETTRTYGPNHNRKTVTETVVTLQS